MTTELLAGRIDVSFATLPSVIGYIDAGVLRALAVASPKRAPRACRTCRRWPKPASPASRPTPGSRCSRRRRHPGRRIDGFTARSSAALDDGGRSKAIAAQGMTLALRPPGRGRRLAAGRGAKWAAVIKAAGVVVE